MALMTGLVAPHVVNHLDGALDADDALVGSVIDSTMRQKRDEARLDSTLWKLQDAIWGKKRRWRVQSERSYRNSFRPHLQVQTERAVAFTDFRRRPINGKTVAHRPPP